MWREVPALYDVARDTCHAFGLPWTDPRTGITYPPPRRKKGRQQMASYYDDNYGWYEIESQDDIDFYHRTQRESVRKKCQGCGQMVRIKPEYAYCNACAEKRERGIDI